MEGKYTKIGTVVTVIALAITIWQLLPPRCNASGEWKMVTKVKAADYKKYVGNFYEWKMHLIQDGNKLSGTAEKIKLNGVDLEYAQRTKITIDGIIDDDNFRFNYTEHGKKRESCGSMCGTIDDSNIIGSFSQTASNSSGELIAKKYLQNN